MKTPSLTPIATEQLGRQHLLITQLLSPDLRPLMKVKVGSDNLSLENEESGRVLKKKSKKEKKNVEKRNEKKE
jgi:hypothetical protein